MDPDGPVDSQRLSTSLLAEIGKVVVVGAALEDATYFIGEALGLDLRTGSATEGLKKIRKLLEPRVLPAWVDDAARVREDVIAWTRTCTSAFNQRNDLIHARHFSMLHPQRGLAKYVQSTNMKPQKALLDEERVRGLVERLRVLRREGDSLHVQLLPKFADGIYYMLRGPYAGGLIIRNNEHGWPDRPSDEQKQAWVDEFWNTYFPS